MDTFYRVGAASLCNGHPTFLQSRQDSSRLYSVVEKNCPVSRICGLSGVWDGGQPMMQGGFLKFYVDGRIDVAASICTFSVSIDARYTHRHEVASVMGSTGEAATLDPRIVGRRARRYPRMTIGETDSLSSRPKALF